MPVFISLRDSFCFWNSEILTEKPSCLRRKLFRARPFGRPRDLAVTLDSLVGRPKWMKPRMTMDNGHEMVRWFCLLMLIVALDIVFVLSGFSQSCCRFMAIFHLSSNVWCPDWPLVLTGVSEFDLWSFVKILTVALRSLFRFCWTLQDLIAGLVQCTGKGIPILLRCSRWNTWRQSLGSQQTAGMVSGQFITTSWFSKGIPPKMALN